MTIIYKTSEKYFTEILSFYIKISIKTPLKCLNIYIYINNCSREGLLILF